MDRDTDQPLSWQSRAAWVVLLGGFFFLVYGVCNWITWLREPVGSFVWNWERRIPFVPAMVVPYMSLDLFFAGAILLCGRRELATHARRVVAAIVIAAAGFLLFPLRFAFVRPETGGFPGMFFNWLALDRPYNQAPSLHIALCSIVWAPYGRRARGPLRWALIAWFLLVGASVLFTYQHHAIDVITGGVLAVVVFYLFPGELDASSSTPRHFRATAVYALPAVILTVLSILLRPWGLIGLWPACSLALVAAAYAGIGPRVFRKRNGRHAWAATVLLGPYFLGARISRTFLHRSTDTWNAVIPNLILGRLLKDAQAKRLIASGVTAVLDLTPECREPRALCGLEYKNVQILDWTVASEQQLRECVAFIEQHSRSGKVFVHCALGVARSAAVVAAYLVQASLASSAEEAIGQIKSARPQIVVSGAWIELLRATRTATLP